MKDTPTDADNITPESTLETLRWKEGTTTEETKQFPTTILTSPHLLEIIQQELDKKIVGELIARHCILLTAFGSLVKNRTTSSFNLMVNCKSGTGKDYVTQKVLDILPKEKVYRRTRISPTAFTYWHNSKWEPDWTWDGKVCYLQDISNAVLNCDVFKVMVSDGSHATVVKDQRAIDIEIRGKPVVIITTANATPAEELLRRFPIIDLDETNEQTKAIMKRWAQYATWCGSAEYDNKVMEALRRLNPVDVIIPYADLLAESIDASNVILRTNFIRLMDYIKASAALHQLQRRRSDPDQDGMLAGFVVAEPIDYEYARIALQPTLSNPQQIPLTKKQKRLIQVVADLGDCWHKVSEIRAKTTFLSEPLVYKYLDELAENFFDVDSQQDTKNDGAPTGKPYMVYKLKKVKDVKLLKVVELFKEAGGKNPPYLTNLANLTPKDAEYLAICENALSSKCGFSVKSALIDLIVLKEEAIVSSSDVVDYANFNSFHTSQTELTKTDGSNTPCTTCGLHHCNYTHKVTGKTYCQYCAEDIEKNKEVAK